VAGVRTSFLPNKTWDNWFIQLGAGTQMFVGESFSTDNIGDKLSYPALNLSIGRWWKPYWGFRIKAQDVGMFVGDFKDFENGVKIEALNVHLDAMWNMSQYFGKYNSKRFFSFIPYAGIGWYMRNEIENLNLINAPGTPRPDAMNGLTVNGGLLFQFRLSDHVGLHIDLAGAMVPDDKLNGILYERYDGVASATAGFTFNLGKTYFEVVQPMDQGLINDLNSKINALRAENAELSKRPVSCPPQKECPPVQTIVPPAPVAPATFESVVLFRISSAVIDANQRININRTADFVKNNSNEKIKVIGYADRQTGSPAYNLRLSERRARAVAQELTSRYGIPSNRIIVEWKGDTEQPFKENAWNRVVIMRAQ
jgi:outer membrane protein OmpA-like peptidoglycan-associated protein